MRVGALRTAAGPAPERVREGAELRVPEQEGDLGQIRVGALEILERQSVARLLDQLSIDEAAFGELSLQRPGARAAAGRDGGKARMSVAQAARDLHAQRRKPRFVGRIGGQHLLQALLDGGQQQTVRARHLYG